MLKPIVAGALMLATGLVGAFPIGVSHDGPASGSEYEIIAQAMRDLSGGTMEGEGKLIIWHPDGTFEARAIDTAFFLTVTKSLTDMVDQGTNFEAANPAANGGVGVGAIVQVPLPPPFGPTQPPTQFWPFCDAATTYVYYTGSPPAGASFAHLDGGAQATGTSVCPALGSPFGQSYAWSDVTIDSTLLPAGTTVVRQVGVAEVMLPPTSVGQVAGMAGGYIIGRQVGSGHGVGAAVTMIWTSAFGTLSADMFRGEAAVVLVGDSQL